MKLKVSVKLIKELRDQLKLTTFAINELIRQFKRRYEIIDIEVLEAKERQKLMKITARYFDKEHTKDSMRGFG